MFSGIQESHAPPMTIDQCMGFVGLVFDQDGDGAISRGEFYYMVEFIVACNYIESLTKDHSSKVTHSRDYSSHTKYKISHFVHFSFVLFVAAHMSPLTAHRSPLAAHLSPLTTHRSPLAAHTKVTPEMRAKLPAELVDLLTSPEFAERCIANFESLDTDGSGKLEADELNEGSDGASRDDLAPAIVSLLGGLDGTLTGPPISIEQCLGFATLFDQVTALPQ